MSDSSQENVGATVFVGGIAWQVKNNYFGKNFVENFLNFFHKKYV